MPYTEKDGKIAPALVIGVVDIPKKDEKTGEVLKTTLGNDVEDTKLRVLVFSDATMNPYKAEITL